MSRARIGVLAALALASLAGAADEDERPRISINDVTVTEGANVSARFTVSLDRNPSGDDSVRVSYETRSGSAKSGSDFSSRSGSLTFRSGGALSQTISVPIVNDTTAESTETFTVRLQEARRATIADNTGVGTIVDDDRGGTQPSVSINNVTVTEGGTANFTVSLSAASSQTVTVVASTADGSATAPGDYTARNNVTVTFPAGSTTQTFAVATVDDGAVEQTETFAVNLSNPTNATIGDGQAVGTINDNDVAALPSLSIGNVSQTEGNTGTSTFTFTASLSAPAPTGGVSFSFATANGSAQAGSDYVATTGSRTIGVGNTTATIPVTVNGDTTVEPNETFALNLTGATNTSNATASATGTIVNDDQAPGASLSINDVTVAEGGTATFTVTLSAPSTQSVTVAFSTANGTATAPGDFTAVTNRTLTIAAGQTSTTTQVVTVNDTAAEGNETFSVTLANPVNATIADGQGVGTITDNDFANAAEAHASMVRYDGPQTCLGCHEAEARQMHGSVHYQQNGPTDFVTNISGNGGEGPAGRVPAVATAIGINTYCGTHQSSPRFTCSGCHVGNGRFPKTPAELAALTPVSEQLKELANIDCLMCHQQAYKRFPNWLDASGQLDPNLFEDLVLVNVSLSNPDDPNSALVASPGNTVTRTGLDGVPVVGPAGDFEFRPAGAPGSLQFALPASAPMAPMTLTTEQAAQQVHPTTRQSCLNCHAGAAGADGAKRGDLSTALINPPVTLDMHMSPDAGGANLTCSSCHNVTDANGNSLHRVRGRGVDLRANDVATRFTCDNSGCHSSTPHGAVTNGTALNRHTAKVACQTCHIPTYAKVVGGVGIPTETVRDWQKPHLSQTACNGRGGWLPEETKASNLQPSYRWFNGTSEVYYLTEPLTNVGTKPLDAATASLLGFATGTPAYILGEPLGAVNDATAKIYPMKEHWGKLARNTSTNTLIPHSTYEFFRTGSFCRAVAIGLGQNPDSACAPGLNTGVPSGAQVVPVHTYQTINHGVEVASNALGANNQCGTCHSLTTTPGTGLRMQLSGTGGLGYDLREPAASNGLCNNCHSGRTPQGLVQDHDRHRNRSGVTCNSCHLYR